MSLQMFWSYCDIATHVTLVHNFDFSIFNPHDRQTSSYNKYWKKGNVIFPIYNSISICRPSQNAAISCYVF